MTHPTRTMRKTSPLLAVVLLFALAAEARAGSFHTYSCRTPSGATAPTEGWSSTLASPSMEIRNSCAAGGELKVNFAGSVPAGAIAGWRYTVPETLGIGRVRLWRSGGAAGKSASGGLPYWLISRRDTLFPRDAIEVCGQDPATENCVSRGDGFNALSDQNVKVFEGLGAPTFWATVQCGGENQCDPGGSLPAAFLNIHAADVELLDSASPTVASTTGDLLDPGPVSGRRMIGAELKDIGSGVHSIDLEVDGNKVASSTVTACAASETAADGTRAFTQRIPCPASASASIEFDTTTVTDGEHRVRLVGEDAAGNRTSIVERTITVYNTPATPVDAQGITGAVNPFAQPGHLPNGSGAAEGLKPRLRILSGSRERVSTSGPRRTIRLSASLATPTGQPVAGARLAVVSKVSGRTPEQLTGFQTTDDSGRVTFTLPAGPTRTLRLAYYAFSDSRTFTLSPAVVALARTTITMRVSPRRLRAGQLVRITGSVSRDGMPAGGIDAILQGYQKGLGWRTFRSPKVDARTARFETRYRVRYSANRLRFRIVVRSQEGYPYATSIGPSASVRVR